MDQPLMEAGLDSLGAVDLRNALSAEFGVALPPTVTFDHPTLPVLAAFVAGLLPRQGAAADVGPDQAPGAPPPAAAAATPEADQSALRCSPFLSCSCHRGHRGVTADNSFLATAFTGELNTGP